MVTQASLKPKGNGLYGTPGFIAPEAAQDGVYSKQSDIYSLGVSLYRILNEFNSNDFTHAILWLKRRYSFLSMLLDSQKITLVN